MSALTLIAFAGMLIAAGMVLAVHAVRPAAPQLSAALARLTAAPVSASATATPVASGADRWGLLPTSAARFFHAHVGVGEADLAITDTTRAQLAARKVARAGAGLLMPAVTTAALAVIGVAPPVVLPAGLALALAVIGWVTPSTDVKTTADRARREFRAALRSFLTLVAQERAARGSPTEALEEASRPWRAWPFRLIHTEVLRAELAGEPPWDALRTLGARLGVQELRALADIVSTAADGAAVFDTLLAEARTLRHADLTVRQADANATSERLVLPIAVLAVGFVLLILIPPLLRLFTT